MNLPLAANGSKTHPLKFSAVNKTALLAAIIAQLSAELKTLTTAALSSHAEATDAENKAENKYDTRGLEASYLAQGQSDAAEETAKSLDQFQARTLRTIIADDPIILGALVTLGDTAGKTTFYFVGPRAGGTQVEHEGQTVTVVTMASPLGQRIIGRRAGDTLPATSQGRPNLLHILHVE